MAYQSGTFSNFVDFVDKIKDFAVANGWTLVLEQTVDTDQLQIVLRSSSFRGSVCHVGFSSFKDGSSSTYCVAGAGYSGYNYGIAFNAWTGWLGQAWELNTEPAYGASETQRHTGMIYTGNSGGSYHIYTDGRKIVIMSTNSSMYNWSHFYIGYYKPFASSASVTFPIAVLGVNKSSYSSSHFPFWNNYNITFFYSTACKVKFNSSWLSLQYDGTKHYTIQPIMNKSPDEAPDSGIILRRCHIIDNKNNQCFGVLDFYVAYKKSGAFSSGDIIEVGTKYFLVTTSVIGSAKVGIMRAD